MKKRTIILLVILVLVILLFLDRCVWNKVPEDLATAQPAPGTAVEAMKAKFQRVIDAPLPSITFTPPPAPPPPPEPAPVVAPVVQSPKRPSTTKSAPRPAAAQPKKPAPSSRQQTAPADSGRPTPSAVENGAYYVVRQKVERNGTYYLVCTIMGDPVNRSFGYAVSAEQYQRAERGLVYDSKNMTGWRRVSRID